MWRIFWIVVAALIGAGLGALAMVPGIYTELDGLEGCKECGSYTTVLAGFTFRDYDAARGSTIAAVVVGAAFALAAWGLLSVMDRRRTRRATASLEAVDARQG